MGEPFRYISVTRYAFHNNMRHAYLGEVPTPEVYGAQGGLRSYYGRSGEELPSASTLDHLVAAVGG